MFRLTHLRCMWSNGYRYLKRVNSNGDEASFLFKAVAVHQTLTLWHILPMVEGLNEYILIRITCELSAKVLPLIYLGGCPRGVMVKAMDCRTVVSEFVLQSRCYVHFREDTLGKGMNPPYPSSYGLNSTTTVLLGEWLWHYLTYKGWYAIKQRNHTNHHISIDTFCWHYGFFLP